jgi:hypothetical protein
MYGRSTPFHRSQIGPALLLADNLQGTAATIPPPAGSLLFFSLIAVDNQGAQSPW